MKQGSTTNLEWIDMSLKSINEHIKFGLFWLESFISCKEFLSFCPLKVGAFGVGVKSIYLSRLRIQNHVRPDEASTA